MSCPRRSQQSRAPWRSCLWMSGSHEGCSPLRPCHRAPELPGQVGGRGQHRCIIPGAAPDWGPQAAFHPDCSAYKVMSEHYSTTGPRGEPGLRFQYQVQRGSRKWVRHQQCILSNSEHLKYGFPGGTVVKKKKKKCACQNRFNPWVKKISWRRKWQPIPVFLPGESH